MDIQGLRKAYHALSDEIRILIVRLLSEYGELCVCQLQPALDISQPNLSFHLRILRDAGIVRSEKRGKWVYYSLNLKNPVLKANLPVINQISVGDINIKCDL
ncbi:transcriptional regulator, ArsR family [Persephonella hydrogeniphila]|uniref:Transcriptional regulator, ArsR family n=1 Tax=Persephonella hydrogeniphila TaxID=198703 RepID=A0A285NFX4_9AQUI|nr:metalloregulator ArsR/SmtB family transcription factor [Persephonella hydrogeniphila]SNZ08412.1 transcriptional regulator, ArsR family [Persephonella hydrogeniphila]